jgi:hypothetical protein
MVAAFFHAQLLGTAAMMRRDRIGDDMADSRLLKLGRRFGGTRSDIDCRRYRPTRCDRCWRPQCMS